jgi:hypothetical protein
MRNKHKKHKYKHNPNKLGHLNFHGIRPRNTFGATQRPGNLSGFWFGDIATSDMVPLRGYMAQWQSAIASNTSGLAAQALLSAASLAGDLSQNSAASAQTSSVLGSIADSAATLGRQAQSGDLSFSNSSTYLNLNGNINLLVTVDSSGQTSSGAETYVTGVNVTTDASAATRTSIANRQQALRNNVAAFMPGGVWSVSETLNAVSAAQIQPLQDEWASINSVINNSSLTDDDRNTLLNTQNQLVRALGIKSAASSAAGSGPSIILDVISDPKKYINACSTMTGPLALACQHPWLALAAISIPILFIIKL